MKLNLAVIADYASISMENKISISGIFDNIWAPQLPVAHYSWFLVLRFKAESQERGDQHRLRIQLMDPDATEVFVVETQVLVPDIPLPGDVTMGAINQLPPTLFTRAGPHVFTIFIDGQEQERIEFEVGLLSAAAGCPFHASGQTSRTDEGHTDRLGTATLPNALRRVRISADGRRRAHDLPASRAPADHRAPGPP